MNANYSVQSEYSIIIEMRSKTRQDKWTIHHVSMSHNLIIYIYIFTTITPIFLLTVRGGLDTLSLKNSITSIQPMAAHCIASIFCRNSTQSGIDRPFQCRFVIDRFSGRSHRIYPYTPLLLGVPFRCHSSIKMYFICDKPHRQLSHTNRSSTKPITH